LDKKHPISLFCKAEVANSINENISFISHHLSSIQSEPIGAFIDMTALLNQDDFKRTPSSPLIGFLAIVVAVMSIRT